MSALLVVLLCGRLYADPPVKAPGTTAIAQTAIEPPATQPPGKPEPPSAAKPTYLKIATGKIFDTQPPGKPEPPDSVWQKGLPPTAYRIIRQVGPNKRE